MAKAERGGVVNIRVGSFPSCTLAGNTRRMGCRARPLPERHRGVSERKAVVAALLCCARPLTDIVFFHSHGNPGTGASLSVFDRWGSRKVPLPAQVRHW